MNPSIVSADQTGTLSQNSMSVVTGSISIHAKFIRNLKENRVCTNTPDQEQDQPREQDLAEVANEPRVNWKHADDFSMERGDINMILSPQLKH